MNSKIKLFFTVFILFYFSLSTQCHGAKESGDGSITQREQRMTATGSIRPAEQQPAGTRSIRPAEQQPAGTRSIRPAEQQPAGTMSIRQAEQQPDGTRKIRPAEQQPAGTMSIRQAEQQPVENASIRKREQVAGTSSIIHQQTGTEMIRPNYVRHHREDPLTAGGSIRTQQKISPSYDASPSKSIRLEHGHHEKSRTSSSAHAGDGIIAQQIGSIRPSISISRAIPTPLSLSSIRQSNDSNRVKTNDYPRKFEKGCKRKLLEEEVELRVEINENGKKVHKNIKIMQKYWTMECGIEKKDEINFILLGDIGGYEYKNEKDHLIGHIATPGQWKVAMGIQKYAQQKKDEHSAFELDFVLNLGDNFYDSGICEDDREQRFNEIFMKVYIKSNHLAIPFYSINGNNDYKVPKEKEILNQKGKNDEQNKTELFEEARKRAKAQIGYEPNGHKNIWNFPAEQYIVHYQFEGKNGKLVNAIFVMIDTFLLCGSSRKDFRHKIICNEKTLAQKVNMDWLERELTFVNENWKPDFLFVLGHYPLYVTKGKRSFLCAEKLQELFFKFNVTAYIAGHEHNLKYIKRLNEKIKMEVDEVVEVVGPMVHQIVSGGGSRLEDCWDEKHVSYMRQQIDDKFCYPNGVQKRKGRQQHDEKEKKEMKDEKKKNKKEEKEEEEDGGTVFEGGTFIAVKITEKSAMFEFYATGKKYPIENAAKEREDWKKKVKEIFESKRKSLEEEMMENGNLENPKLLGHIELKRIKIG